MNHIGSLPQHIPPLSVLLKVFFKRDLRFESSKRSRLEEAGDENHFQGPVSFDFNHNDIPTYPFDNSKYFLKG